MGYWTRVHISYTGFFIKFFNEDWTLVNKYSINWMIWLYNVLAIFELEILAKWKLFFWIRVQTGTSKWIIHSNYAYFSVWSVWLKNHKLLVFAFTNAKSINPVFLNFWENSRKIDGHENKPKQGSMDGKDQLVRFGSGPVAICNSRQFIPERELENFRAKNSWEKSGVFIGWKILGLDIIIKSAH